VNRLALATDDVLACFVILTKPPHERFIVNLAPQRNLRSHGREQFNAAFDPVHVIGACTD
jgi:hypothetical protein